MPRLSVVVPCYNAAAVLPRLLQCLAQQTFGDFEAVLVDDASTDDTRAVCDRIGDSLRVRLVTMPENRGPAAARNRGIAATDSEFIAVVDADDLLHPRRLERLIEVADTKRLDWIADDQIFVDARSLAPLHLLWGKQEAPADGSTLCRLLVQRSGVWGRDRGGFATMKPLFRRSALEARGLVYDEAFRVLEDLEFYFRCSLDGMRFGWEIDPMYYYTVRRDQRSGGRDIDAMVRLQSQLVRIADSHGDPAMVRSLMRRGRAVARSAAFYRALRVLREGRPGAMVGGEQLSVILGGCHAIPLQIGWRLNYRVRIARKRVVPLAALREYRRVVADVEQSASEGQA